MVCANPGLVNPGAFEVAGNGVDDDCDGAIDNAAALCDSGLASNSGSPMDYAKAIDLCQTTTESSRRWGVISASLTLANGTGTPNALSRSIRPGFGSVIGAQRGQSLAVLSTGVAADLTDTDPPYAAFQQGQDMGTESTPPADWFVANGGQFPNAPSCPAASGNTAYDSVMLRLRVRVPTNAQSFSTSLYFLSAEYPEWTCTPYNDFFVALLNSSFNGSPPNPVDKNLAFYDPPPAGPPYYPVGVNLATGNTGLFKQCLNGPFGCDGSNGGTITTCVGTQDLTGTGFDHPLGGCGANNLAGGGTGWLVARGNVRPGEIIELRFAIWDTSDPAFDSLVLLDNFQWSLNASQPGTGEQ